MTNSSLGDPGVILPSDDAHATVLLECRRVAILEGRRRGMDHADAEDVASCVSIQLLLTLRQGKPIKSVTAWTRKATQNYIINQHRDASRLKRGGGLVESLTGVSEDQFARS
jgi:DNA-directed RNA polymerase specialized sigma24 family protein